MKKMYTNTHTQTADKTKRWNEFNSNTIHSK